MRFACLLLVLLVGGLGLAPAEAQVPQTIVVDGVNDFNPLNLLEDDSADTDTSNFCADDPEGDTPMDIGQVFLTNDNSFLYFGYEYDRECFSSPQVNLGFAIDVNDSAGGATDAFNREIAWDNVPLKPDFYVYGVLDGFNYEVLYSWNGSGWSVVQDGSNGLGIVDDTGFQEGKLSLATLGVAPGDTINVEFWMTQDGTSKPALDAVCSDTVQTSTPTGTVFDDEGNPSQMYCMIQYIVQTFVDNVPPTANRAEAVGFVTDVNGQIGTTTTTIDVTFSEPVGTGANVAGNYSVSNTAATVISAVVDGGDATVVHLTLSGSIGPSAGFYDVTVQNVQDLNGNAVVVNGTDNVASFFLKKVRFEGNMSVFLLTNSAPVDSFNVEGSLSPLTFTQRDNALGQDADVDSIYVTNVPFSVDKSKVTGVAESTLEWKWNHYVQGFEPRPNRQHLLSSDNGDCDTLNVFWNDDLPSSVTSGPVDVCFQVNANLFNPTALDTISLVGDQAPLPSFVLPGLELLDDGNGADSTAGDGIYSVYVRFPVGTFKTVNFKYGFNSQFECFGQGNRNVFLNDAEFDTVGGANGPIVLPARSIDRCTTTDKAIPVIFRLDTDFFFGGQIDSVQLAGNQSPLSFTNILSFLKDDGVAPDAFALDDTFSVRVVFPDSTNFDVEYKYLINGVFECEGFGNRTFNLDDTVHSLSNPKILPVAVWNFCEDVDVTAVPGDGPRPRVTLHLAQNYPNPFRASRTTIEFEADQPGRATLEVFDVAGRRVKTVLSRDVPEGLNLVQWDARDESGRDVAPGIYFYRLTMGKVTETRRMVITAN